MPTANPRLDWALHLAGRGWPVFPLLPSAKRPAIRNWEQRATTDSDKITAFWTTHPSHNIGLPAGRAGLLVVDLDVPHAGQAAPTDDERMRGATCGAHVLARLACQAQRSIPDTWAVFTPSGGTHLYFRQPTGHALRNTAGTLGWLIDTRGHGGYVVAPGSATVDGGYELAVESDPADLPVWLSGYSPIGRLRPSQRLAGSPLRAWAHGWPLHSTERLNASVRRRQAGTTRRRPSLPTTSVGL